MKTNPNFKTIHYADGSSMSYIPQPIFNQDVEAPAQIWLDKNGTIIKHSLELPDYIKELPVGRTGTIQGYKLHSMKDVERMDRIEALMKKLYRNLNDPRVDPITKIAAWIQIGWHKLCYFICLYKDILISKLIKIWKKILTPIGPVRMR